MVDTFDLITESYNFALAEFLDRKLGKDEVLALCGPTIEEILARSVPEEYMDVAVERYHEYFNDHFKSEAKIFPGISKVLTLLERAGVMLAVFTGAGRRVANITLRESGILHYFSTVITGDDVTQPKPDPEGLSLVMAATGAPRHQVIYIGDHPDDVEASRRARIRTAAALWGTQNRQELTSLRPDYVFNYPADALRLLGPAFETPASASILS